MFVEWLRGRLASAALAVMTGLLFGMVGAGFVAVWLWTLAVFFATLPVRLVRDVVSIFAGPSVQPTQLPPPRMSRLAAQLPDEHYTQLVRSLSSSSLLTSCPSVCLSFDEAAGELLRGHSALASLGGKGTNLVRLVRAGFPVPPGFCVTTAAFRSFIQCADNNEAAELQRLLAALSAADADASALSGQVRELLSGFPFPAAVAEQLSTQLRSYGAEARFAVRSSGTAEDLPGAAFAGQHDTYLNVRGFADVCRAVQQCWCSAYTERAVLYRARQGFDQRAVDIAVVVQVMVRPLAAGVLFTADPLTGHRDTLTVDAGYGLGEAVVSGLVSGDCYRVHAPSWTLQQCRVGRKHMAVRAVDGETATTVTEPLSEEQSTRQVLTAQQIADLCALGLDIQRHFGCPQDVEWAVCETSGELFVLQSRAITTLYPLPDDDHNSDDDEEDSDKKPATAGDELFVSFGHVQMMTDAMSPMGCDVWKLLMAPLVGCPLPADASKPMRMSLLREAGGRLFVNPTPLLRTPWLRDRVLAFLAHVYPSIPRIIADHVRLRPLARPSLSPSLPQLRWLVRAVRALLALLLRCVYALVCRPHTAAQHLLDEAVRQLPAGLDHQLALNNAASDSDAAAVATAMRYLTSVLPYLAPRSYSSVGPAMVSAGLLRRLFAGDAAASELVELLPTGLDRNVTSQMDQHVAALAALLRQCDAIDWRAMTHEQLQAELLRRYRRAAADDDEPFTPALRRFLAQFGSRCHGEIDVARPRWREDPSLVLAAIVGNTSQRDSDAHVQRRRSADRAVQSLCELTQRRYGSGLVGRVLAACVRRLALNVRVGMGLREHPKFAVIGVLDRLRSLMLAVGGRLQGSGALERPDDVFWLHFAELHRFAADHGHTGARQCRRLVAQRKRAALRHAQLKAPLVMTARGEQLTAKPPADLPPNSLAGLAASPGVVEATVAVVVDPQSQILPAGCILVAPHTDPCWTPLFLHAAGLITDVGGLLTHGSVTAREYRLPAVVSVADATSKLRTGDVVRLDGHAGIVTLLSRPLL